MEKNQHTNFDRVTCSYGALTLSTSLVKSGSKNSTILREVSKYKHHSNSQNRLCEIEKEMRKARG